MPQGNTCTSADIFHSFHKTCAHFLNFFVHFDFLLLDYDKYFINNGRTDNHTQNKPYGSHENISPGDPVWNPGYVLSKAGIGLRKTVQEINFGTSRNPQ